MHLLKPCTELLQDFRGHWNCRHKVHNDEYRNWCSCYSLDRFQVSYVYTFPLFASLLRSLIVELLLLSFAEYVLGFYMFSKLWFANIYLRLTHGHKRKDKRYVILGLSKCSVSKLFFHLQIIRVVLTSYCRLQLHFINEKNMQFWLSNIEVKWSYHFLSFIIVFWYFAYNASTDFCVCHSGTAKVFSE